MLGAGEVSSLHFQPPMGRREKRKVGRWREHLNSLGFGSPSISDCSQTRKGASLWSSHEGLMALQKPFSRICQALHPST